MAIYIDTTRCKKISLEDAQGTFSEIMNEELCGAKTGTAKLRWLEKNETFHTNDNFRGIQLLYIIEGQANVVLGDENYDIKKGAGVYLGNNEMVSIKNPDEETLRLFHIEVPKK